MEKVQLGEIFEYLPKSKLKAGEGKEEGKYKFFTSSNIQNKFINEFIYDGEYLIFGTGGKASINYCNEKFSTSTDNFVVKVRKDFNPKLIYLYFKNDMTKLEKGFKGASIKHISKEYINQLIISKYNYEEQIRIVNKLDKVQEIIDVKIKQIKDLDKLIKSQFVELFGDINLNDKVWNIDILKNHLKVIGGYAFKSSEFQNTGIPVLRIGNINAGYFRPKDLMFYNEDEKLKKYIIYPNDVVMSLTGTVGKDDYGNVCIMGNDFEKYYLNQRNAKLELKTSLNKMYISYALRVPEIKKRLTGISRGVRQANISNKDIENLDIPIPPIELQNHFAEFVELIDKQKFEIQKSLKEMQKLQESLMNKYFGD